MTEIVHTGRNNTNTVIFSEDGETISFDDAISMELTLVGIGVIADTLINPALIDFSAGDGVVTFNLGSLDDVPNGKYDAELAVFDAQHLDGQHIADPNDPNMADLIFIFVD